MKPTTVSPAAMRIVRVLAGNPPHTVQQLVAATGVTRTAVTEQIKDLMANGLVARTTERVERGRPRYLYTATDHALATLFPNNQWLMVPALLKAMWDIAGPKVSRDIMSRVSEVLVHHYRERVTADNPEERLRQFAKVLSDEGILAEVSEENGQLQFRQRNCPYADMIDDDRHICTTERAMFRAVVGESLTVTGCRLDGCSSCTFELAAGDGDG